MRCGDLNCFVSLQHRVENDDATGDPIPTWQEYAQVWAQLQPERGSEGVLEGQIHATRGTRITLRYRSDVVERDRLVHEGVNYNLEAVLNRDYRRDELTLLATSGANDG